MCVHMCKCTCAHVSAQMYLHVLGKSACTAVHDRVHAPFTDRVHVSTHMYVEPV